MVLLLAGAIAGEKSAPAISWGAIALLAAAGVATVMGPEHATAFRDAFVADGFSRFAKLLILGGAAFSILLADEFFSDIKLSRFELAGLVGVFTFGVFFFGFSARLFFL